MNRPFAAPLKLYSPILAPAVAVATGVIVDLCDDSANPDEIGDTKSATYITQKVQGGEEEENREKKRDQMHVKQSPRTRRRRRNAALQSLLHIMQSPRRRRRNTSIILVMP